MIWYALHTIENDSHISHVIMVRHDTDEVPIKVNFINDGYFTNIVPIVSSPATQHGVIWMCKSSEFTSNLT